MAGQGLQSVANQLASYGRGPDKMLAHISPDEAQLIDYLQGGRRTNPVTGLPEYGLFGKILKGIVRAGAAIGGFAVGGPAGAAAASAAATKLTGGSWKNALTTGALSGLGGWAGQALSGGGTGLTGAIGEGVKTGGLSTFAAAAPGSLTPAAMQAIQQGGMAAIAPTIGAVGLPGMLAAAGTAGGVGAALPAAFVKDMPSGSNGPPPGWPAPNNMTIKPWGLTVANETPSPADLMSYGRQGGLPSFQFTKFDWRKPDEEIDDTVNPASMARGGRVRRYAEGGEIAGPRYQGVPADTPGWVDRMNVKGDLARMYEALAVERGKYAPWSKKYKTITDQMLQLWNDRDEYAEQPFIEGSHPGGAPRIVQEMYARGGPASLKKSQYRRSARAKMRAKVTGPGDGSGMDDRVPALLTAGEHVVDKESVDLLGGGSNERGHARLEKIKSGARKSAGLPSPHLSAAERAERRAGVK